MKLSLLTLTFALVAGLAFAQGEKKKGEGKGGPVDPAKRAEGMMKKLDTNSDGKISKEEWAAGPMAAGAKAKGGDEAVNKGFARIDKNSDGNIDMDELKSMPAGKGKKKDA
ncbi:MAG: hypothetical protein KDM63_06545 [Verrucomicrobiae bacterium]|nr:hypothetical protein [Verrucomicrobiae bacterium]